MNTLPTSLLTDILMSWIRTKDLARVDSALCNRRLRGELLSILSSQHFLTEGIPNGVSADSFMWLLKRRVTVTSFTWSCTLPSFIPWLQMSFFFRSLRLVRLRQHSRSFQHPDFCNSVRRMLVSNAATLTILDASGCSFLEAVLTPQFWTATLCLPALRELDLVRASLSANSLCRLLERCPGLEILRLSHPTASCDAALAAAARNCPQLRSLHVDGGSCTAAGLSAFTGASCLREIGLTHCAGVRDYAVLALLSRCNQLTHVLLQGCVAVSDELLNHIADDCGISSRLVSLDVSHCALITDDGLRRIAASCPRLQLLRADFPFHAQLSSDRI